MRDARVYRAAFLPAFLVLFVVAFSLENRPAPAGTTLAPEAFSGARAFGEDSGGRPARNSLLELAQSFPDRRPGSAGDELLADRVADELATDQRFTVRRLTSSADTGREKETLTTVVGVRPGVSSRRIVVLAHRDAVGPGAVAELSATAVLLELARIADLRDLRRTLVLVSTSGGTTGAAGARAWASAAGEVAQVDGVLVLGDLASEDHRRPWVVPWSNDSRPAPLSLRRTAEAAVRMEANTDAGGARALVQWIRRALPITVGEQGELLAAGLPAVLLQVSGEPGPEPEAAVSQRRLDVFGRAALRTITALDEAPAPASGEDTGGGPPSARETDGIVTVHKVLPTWAVRIAVLALVLPALLAALDACMRVERRGLRTVSWLAWAAAGAAPFLLAWAWARGLDLVGIVDAPRAPVPEGAVPLDAVGAAAMGSTMVVAVAALIGLRPLIARATGAHGSPAAGGGAAAVGSLVTALAIVLAVTNPYAGALLVPAAHLWLLVAAPESRPHRVLTVLAVLAGLLLPALALIAYGSLLDMGPLELAWLLFLAAAGGALELGTAVALSLFAGSICGLAVVLWGRRRMAGERGDDDAVRTRGPLSYAGPGSLGGTQSALRR